MSQADTALWARINGVFWAAFLLFSWTAASIVSGAVIERVRSFAFWSVAVMIGSVTWIIDAAWGWHWDGWMVKLLGYHDAYASGVIHAIAGGTALGMLVHLGPRIGKFRADGTPRNIVPHNPWLVTIGLFLIYAGFWGFYVACNVPIIGAEAIGASGPSFTATTIYLTPTTLSAITVNFLMALSGGLLAGYMISRGDAYWTYSAGLAGIIAASAGNDLYHPIQALIIAAIGVVIIYKLHFWVERTFKIDDAVGAVAVHGYAGFYGVVIAGFVLWGTPSSRFRGLRRDQPAGPADRRGDHVLAAGLPPGLDPVRDLQGRGRPAHPARDRAGRPRPRGLPRPLPRRGRRAPGRAQGGPGRGRAPPTCSGRLSDGDDDGRELGGRSRDDRPDLPLRRQRGRALADRHRALARLAVWQLRFENRTYAAELRRLDTPDKLERAMRRQHLDRPAAVARRGLEHDGNRLEARLP